MPNLVNLNAEAGASMVGDDSSATLALSNTVGPALEVASKGVANASISGLRLTNASMPSGAVMMLGVGAFVSVTTLLFTTGGVAGSGAIRIVKSDGTFGWVPVLPDAAVTAAVYS